MLLVHYALDFLITALPAMTQGSTASLSEHRLAAKNIMSETTYFPIRQIA